VLFESPITRRAGGLDFSAIGGEKQRHGSALIGAGASGCTAPGLETPHNFYPFPKKFLKIPKQTGESGLGGTK